MKIEEMKKYEKYKAIRNNDGEIVRCGLSNTEDGMMFVYAKGSKSRGWRMTQQQFLANYTLKDEKPDKEKRKWEHNVDRVIKTLEKSGLWDNILAVYKNLKILGYDKKLELYDKCYQYNNNEDEYQKWLTEIEKEYPFIVGYDEEHKRKYIHTDYIWELSRAELKSMYFGKWANATKKKEIAEHLENKKNFSFGSRVNYDVSFEYDAERNKAWYSEEYRGCGNGHYYLALDNNLALFCEND